MLFVHDHTFVKKEESYYTTGSLNQKIMNRYTKWFGKCKVFATSRIATYKDEAFCRQENKVDGIDFHLIPKKNSVFYLLSIRGLIRDDVIKEDCIVVRMSIFGAIAIYYAKKYNKPYLVEMVACPWDSLWYHSIKGKILAPFMTLLTKKMCKNAPWVLYVTNEFLQKRYPSNGITTGCSDVELLSFDDDILIKREKKIEKREKNKLKLCTLANVAVKYKGQDIVIKGLKRLKKLNITCDYYLIGAGNQSRLKQIAVNEGVADQVHFVGPIPHEEVFQHIDDCDIYVQPSLQEGLPRAVIEAMSRACPIVGSSTGGIPELIDKSMIFKKGSITGFVNIIANLGTEKLKECAKNNYIHSMNYRHEYLCKKREEFYTSFYKSV